jgi:hypothetical protein
MSRAKKEPKILAENHIKRYPKGMNDLFNIVATLQKDVKKINKAITLEGAHEYASKKPINKKTGKGWSAYQGDITGADGKPDGIEEVYIVDGYGNLKVINGVTLTKTDYPMRKLIRTEGFHIATDKLGREYKKYASKADMLSFDREANYIYDVSKEFEKVRERAKPRQLFKKIIFDEAFGPYKEHLRVKDTGADGKVRIVNGMEIARIYNKGLTDTYNQYILFPLSKGGNMKAYAKDEKNLEEIEKYVYELANPPIEDKDEAKAAYRNLIDEISDFIANNLDSWR